MEIGRLLGYFLPVFGATTSEKSGKPANKYKFIGGYFFRHTVAKSVDSP